LPSQTSEVDSTSALDSAAKFYAQLVLSIYRGDRERVKELCDGDRDSLCSNQKLNFDMVEDATIIQNWQNSEKFRYGGYQLSDLMQQPNVSN
jgi:hypothetical protein